MRYAGHLSSEQHLMYRQHVLKLLEHQNKKRKNHYPKDFGNTGQVEPSNSASFLGVIVSQQRTVFYTVLDADDDQVHT